MQRLTGWVVGLAAVTVAVAAAWMTLGSGGAEPDAAEGAASGVQAEADLAALTPDQMRGRLQEQQALSGTEAVGNWCAQGESLKPCLALRERFDYYIDAVGQDDPAKLRNVIEQEARQENGDKPADEIMRIWDKYWRLRTHAWQVQFDPADTRTWMQFYEEQRQVRRQILGEAWTQAFFDADDKQFLAYHAQMTTGRNPSAAPSSAPVPTINP